MRKMIQSGINFMLFAGAITFGTLYSGTGQAQERWNCVHYCSYAICGSQGTVCVLGCSTACFGDPAQANQSCINCHPGS
jgi:hypothetical protein